MKSRFGEFVFAETTYNREQFEKVMVWPGYLMEKTPETLKLIMEEMHAGFSASSKEGTAELSAHFTYKSRAWLLLDIKFKNDGKIGFIFHTRAKTIPVEEMNDIANWIANAMKVLAKYGMI